MLKAFSKIDRWSALNEEEEREENQDDTNAKWFNKNSEFHLNDIMGIEQPTNKNTETARATKKILEASFKES